MTQPVNKDLAILLKEKRFDKETDARYFYDWEYLNLKLSLKGAIKWNPSEEESYPAPTITEVVMWLYEKYGIWVKIGLYVHLGNVSKFQFTLEQQKFKSINSIVQLNINPYNSPTEAYEAAIHYCLTNLIP